MDKLKEGICLNNQLTGDGTGIVEILSIGFEPLLTCNEWNIYKEKKELEKTLLKLLPSKALLEYRVLVTDDEVDSGAYKWFKERYDKVNCKVEKINNLIHIKNLALRKQLIKNINKTRKVFRHRELFDEEQCCNIAIFESDVIRKLGCKNYEFSDKLVTVTTYYTEIFRSVMFNGFTIDGSKYVFFTASAGATRNKKSSFMKEEDLKRLELSLFCGLTVEDINRQNGMNTNKYLAYTALGLSNTKVWDGFDIRKVIVVDDIEYSIPNQKVRHIYTQSQEDKIRQDELKEQSNKIKEDIKSIEITKKYMRENDLKEYDGIKYKDYTGMVKTLKMEKKCIDLEIKALKGKYHTCETKEMSVDIPFTDGFGLSLKEEGSFMIRLPFVKGLISYVPYNKFKKWCKENKFKIGKVVDIYGKEYDIEKDGIEYIFTKSQFKMYKYFNNIYDENGGLLKTGWEVYQDNFEKYNCGAGITNVEDKDMKLNAKTNYQILQTLTTEMTDEDLLNILGEDIETLKGIGNDYMAMLKILNADETKNGRMSFQQKSLVRYPELLKDQYMKNYLKNMKKSIINKLKSGKISINGAYTFIIPDPVACLQWWLLGERDLTKLGFIHGNNVRCALFDDGDEVDCLRSPHLDHAHCIRTIVSNKEMNSWYPTNGLYVGVEDVMSKFLVYDNDGDKALVHNNRTIIKCAKSFQNKYGMIPNYYDMAKANPEMISSDTLFNGILSAYHHGNIGSPSNEITKIFGKLSPSSKKESVIEAMDVVALRCADVNFVIDYAKTLWKPELTKMTKELYKKYGSKKVPHFFKYAKGKNNYQVEKSTDCNIDRLDYLVPDNRIHFKDLPAKYEYKKLITQDVDLKEVDAQKVIELYEFVVENYSNRKASNATSSCNDENKKDALQHRFNNRKLKKVFGNTVKRDYTYIANVLVKYLRNSINKDLLWEVFGEEIYNNICSNVPSNSKFCSVCGMRFEYEVQPGKPHRMCKLCSHEKKKERDRLKKYKKYNSK